jgi:hypothetical protein
MSLEDRISRFQRKIAVRLKELETIEKGRGILVPVPVEVIDRPELETK